ncbi:MAG: hypothetical protein IT378_04185, partial [Sandaracinaceae bacterium]|nr:hypothetical protein [Sandaracinaceae bacterium]
RAPEELEGEASARPVGAFWAAAQWEIVAHAFERGGRRGELSRVLGRAAEHARESGAIGHARELDAWRARLDSIDAAT